MAGQRRTGALLRRLDYQGQKLVAPSPQHELKLLAILPPLAAEVKEPPEADAAVADESLQVT